MSQISFEPGHRPRVAFVMEQSLGHVTHSRNLQTAIDVDPRVTPIWHHVTYPRTGLIESIPPIRGNWSVRASLRTRRLLARPTAQPYDAIFFHTQVTALFSVARLRNVPSVISLDATPLNYDAIGLAYGHRQGSALLEAAKRAANRRSFSAAHALVAWSQWACDSLVNDYGIPASRVSVIPPGVNLEAWPRPIRTSTEGPLQILFVGADFLRKGGDTLLAACSAGIGMPCEIHIVTKTSVEAAPGVHVYPNIGPNSDLLRQLYAKADVFVFPTNADCFALVVAEAMAAGLPVVATDVGAIAEAVVPGKTGILVPPKDPRALRDALAALAADDQRRLALGRQARLVAEQRFDSGVNAKRLVDLLLSLRAS